MTCIVGVVNKTEVWLGGDSAGVSGLDIKDHVDEKVFVKGKMIFGFTTSFRMGQILRYKFNIPKHDDDCEILEYMTTVFIDSWRECLKIGGYNTTSGEGGEFLIGYKGRLFHIFSDYQVSERREGYDACGCGESYALGSLFSTNNVFGTKNRIEKALKSASNFSAGVRGPFVIKRI